MGEIKDKNVYKGELKGYQDEKIEKWLNDGNQFEIGWNKQLYKSVELYAVDKLKEKVEEEFPKANGIVKIFIEKTKDSGGKKYKIRGIPVILKE